MGKIRTRIFITAKFLWLADDLAIYSYGDEDKGHFFRLEKLQWVDMGKPETIFLTVDAP